MLTVCTNASFTQWTPAGGTARALGPVKPPEGPDPTRGDHPKAERHGNRAFERDWEARRKAAEASGQRATANNERRLDGWRLCHAAGPKGIEHAHQHAQEKGAVGTSERGRNDGDGRREG